MCHINPDGDAIGSLTGLGRVLAGLGKRPILVCADPVPPELSFVPGAALISPEVTGPFDLAILLDCSELARCGRGDRRRALDGLPLINIDHHVTNLGYGTIDIVDPSASSTAEVILRLLEHMECALDALTATCLLTGIVTDTRGFRTSNVTVQTMEAALRLVRAGAEMSTITQEALDRRSIGALRLWGAALSAAQVDARVIWVTIPLAMPQEVGFAGAGDAGLASYLVGAEGTDAAAVFVEQGNNTVEVGLRASPGFDVSHVALRFGGGGHALAAGCAQQGPLYEVVKRVLATLQAELACQRENSAGRDTQPQQASRPNIA